MLPCVQNRIAIPAIARERTALFKNTVVENSSISVLKCVQVIRGGVSVTSIDTTGPQQPFAFCSQPARDSHRNLDHKRASLMNCR
jgi:hypothetical protein